MPVVVICSVFHCTVSAALCSFKIWALSGLCSWSWCYVNVGASWPRVTSLDKKLFTTCVSVRSLVLWMLLLCLGWKDFVPISGELSLLWYHPLVFFLCRAPLSEAEPITASLHVHWLHVAKHEAGWYITAGRYDFVTLLPPAAVSWGDSLNCFPTRYGNWNIPLFYNKLYNFFKTSPLFSLFGA